MLVTRGCADPRETGTSNGPSEGSGTVAARSLLDYGHYRSCTPDEVRAPPGAEEFPLMVVISIIYPCNFGCPICPYTDGNSDIRQFYHEHDGDLIPVELWNKMADECGPVRRLDALHRRRRADAPPAHGRDDRVREGEGRARLAEHERQHVRPDADATREARAHHRGRHRPDRVLDGRRRRRRPTPSCGRRTAARRAIRRSGGTTTSTTSRRRSSCASELATPTRDRRLDDPAGGDRGEAGGRRSSSGSRTSASTR